MGTEEDSVESARAAWQSMSDFEKLSFQFAAAIQAAAKAAVEEEYGPTPRREGSVFRQSYDKAVELLTLFMTTTITENLTHFTRLTAGEAGRLGATYSELAHAAGITPQAARKRWPNITGRSQSQEPSGTAP